MPEKKKLHYAWVILLGVTLIRGVAGGGINMTSGLFLAPVAADIGTGIGNLSIYMSISSITMVLCLPYAGKWIHRFDIRLVTAASAFLQAVSFAALGWMQNVAGWYLLAIPQAIGASVLVNLLGPILINRWFAVKEGLMMGIQMAFVGLAGAVLQPVASFLIEKAGWRNAYFLIGGGTLLVVLLTSFFLLRNRPADLGMRPYGEQSAGKENKARSGGAAVQFGRHEKRNVLRSLLFYLLLIFMICITGVAVFTQHIPTFGRTAGFSPAQTGMALAFASVGNAIGSIAIGIISDRIGSLKTCFCLIGAGVAAIIGFFCSSYGFAVFGVSTFLFGILSSGVMVLSPILTIQFFGQADYEQIYAKVSMGAPLASVLLIPVYGFIYDHMQNYIVVLISMMVLLAVSAVCIYVGWKKTNRLEKHPDARPIG